MEKLILLLPKLLLISILRQSDRYITMTIIYNQIPEKQNKITRRPKLPLPASPESDLAL